METEGSSPEEPLYQFELALGEIDHSLNSLQIDYRIIGSVARRAYMNKPIVVTDIDVIVLENSHLPEAQAIFNTIEEKTGVHIDSALSRYLEKRDDTLFLKHGEISYRLDKEVIAPRRVKLKKAEFVTFSPETLLHTYLIPYKNFRPKDWHNSLEFARWVRQNVDYDHCKFVPFHSFAKDIWEKSPLIKVQNVWHQFVEGCPPLLKEHILTMYSGKTFQKAIEIFNQIEEALCEKSNRLPQNIENLERKTLSS